MARRRPPAPITAPPLAGTGDRQALTRRWPDDYTRTEQAALAAKIQAYRATHAGAAPEAREERAPHE